MIATQENQQCYYDNYSLLLSTSNGLVRLHCPFTAECIKSIDVFKEGHRITVVSVQVAPDKKLLYLINGKSYYYTSFRVIANR